MSNPKRKQADTKPCPTCGRSSKSELQRWIDGWNPYANGSRTSGSPVGGSGEDSEAKFEHDRFLDTTCLNKNEKAELLQIINDTITEGLKCGNSLEYEAVRGDFEEVWDLLDRRKLKHVKRLARFAEGLKNGD